MVTYRHIFICVAVALVGCGEPPETVSTGGYPVPDDSNGDANAANGSTNQGTNNASNTNSSSTDGGSNAATMTTGNNETTGSTNNETTAATNNDTTGTNNATPGPQFHTMFIAVADFMRGSCIDCHSEGQNGNFQIRSADATNQEVREAIEDVEATTGNLMIEPNNPEMSQVWIMITNDAGEQFDDATIAIVEDWINAGAPYEP